MKIDWEMVISFVIALAVFELLNKLFLGSLIEGVGNYIG